MVKKTFQLETLVCPSCTAKIEAMFKNTEGIEEGQVSFNTSKAKITFDEGVITTEEIKDKIERLGFDVLKIK